MRKKIVAGNWKMNKNQQEGIDLIKDILPSYSESEVEMIIIPPFIHLDKAAELLSDSKIRLGAQNVHHETNGAYTGEISANMLKSVAVEYCLVGHSERRTYQKESNEQLIAKTKHLLQQSIQPIFCIGETLEERESGKEKQVIKSQLDVLFQLNDSDFEEVVIAYEPVWAIGTGKTATAEQAQEMHSYIRSIVEETYSESIAQELSILYGGSMKPDNAGELFSKQDVDGGLIGGASLDADSFLAIYKAL